MQINRVPLTLDSSKYSAEWDAIRSPGTHLMQIVDRMEREREEVLGNKPRDYSEFAPEELEAYRFAGFMYEHMIAQHIIDVECERSPERLIRPGEFFWCGQCDVSLSYLDPKRMRCLELGHKGIFLTPDAVRADTWRLKEWKFTWKSLKRAGADQQWCKDHNGHWDTEEPHYEHVREGIWRWPVQTMAYCYVLDTLGADLEAFFVNGDYKDRRPKVMRYEMDFTKRDLKENWDAIVSTARGEGWL